MTYLDEYINQFIQFIVPAGKSYFIVSSSSASDNIRGKYDYIILINVLEKEKDIISYFGEIYNHLVPGGRLLIIYQNYLYAYIDGIKRFFWRSKKIKSNWLSKSDIQTFLKLQNFEPLLKEPLFLLSIRIPIISFIANRLLLFFFPFNHLSKIHYILALKPQHPKKRSVSIIIPARNEEGNIENIFLNLPKLGLKREVIIVEGHSQDKTREEIKRCIRNYNNRNLYKFRLLIQTKKGKSDAIHLGIKNAKNEIIIIYDADVTVEASDLTKFYQALVSCRGDFINGSRLVYPIEKQAMQYLNILGNKFFGLLFTFIFSQPLKDTLCGTKAFFRKDYILFERQNMEHLKTLDPFGDFYLLFGAKKLNLKIVDLPVRYYRRSYGKTNINRFKNAWELLKFSIYSLQKLKMRL